jgi:hypothetical protein
MQVVMHIQIWRHIRCTLMEVGGLHHTSFKRLIACTMSFYEDVELSCSTMVRSVLQMSLIFLIFSKFTFC